MNDQIPDVSISGKVIKRENSLRYLGIIFDRSLSGNDHILRDIWKSRKDLNALKMMKYANVPLRILLIIYQTLVMSIVDYGFGFLTLSKTQLASLRVTPNQGMRTILVCTRRHVKQ